MATSQVTDYKIMAIQIEIMSYVFLKNYLCIDFKLFISSVTNFNFLTNFNFNRFLTRISNKINMNFKVENVCKSQV